MSNCFSLSSEVRDRAKIQSIRLTTNEWYRASQLGDSYWLYIVWDPLENPDAKPICFKNLVKHLDHVKREVAAARYYDNSTEAIEIVSSTGGEN